MLLKWTEMHPECKYLQNEDSSSIMKMAKLNLKKGTHDCSKEILEFYKVTKYELNIDTITEFIALSFAEDAVGDMISLFYKMARFLNNNAVLKNWLNGWEPETKGFL
jgi:hypothetical protein